jgi:hypothetical protein
MSYYLRNTEGRQTAMLDKADQSTLNSLRWHWDTAYAINCDGTIRTAIPAAEPEAVLTAGSAMELRTAMQNDYAARAMRANATAARWAGFSSI